MENAKQFCSYMKRLGQGEKGVADLMVNNKIISDGKGKAEALNAQFTKVFIREDKSDVPSLGKSTKQDIPELVINEAGVLKQLQNMSPNKAAGPDQLPPWFLKMVRVKIAPILTDLFRDHLIREYYHDSGRKQTYVQFSRREINLPLSTTDQFY